jgi:hypothetical protein
VKKIILLTILITSLFSLDIKQPTANFISSGFVVDLVYKNDKVYSATDAGIVDIFDFNSKKLIKKIQLPKIKDFLGEDVDSKVYSVDVIDDNVLLLSQDKNGFRRVHIHKDNATKLIIDSSKSLTIAKAKYLNSTTILLALLGNELISYDISSGKQNWLIQVSGAKFSDFALNENKSEVVVGDESGSMKIYTTKDGKLKNTLEGQNLDNVFQVDYKNGIVATAGQDRRVAIYALKSKLAYYKQANFLVYSVGLSPSGNIVAYSSDESNNITVMSTITQSTLGNFGGNKITISDILFINENDFLVSSNSKIINLYKIK